MANSTVILVDDLHPAYGPNGVKMVACRQEWVLKVGVPLDVEHPATAAVLLHIAGKSNLHLEMFDRRRHKELVEEYEDIQLEEKIAKRGKKVKKAEAKEV